MRHRYACLSTLVRALSVRTPLNPRCLYTTNISFIGEKKETMKCREETMVCLPIKLPPLLQKVSISHLVALRCAREIITSGLSSRELPDA